MSPSEVARRLGTSTRTIQRWIATGRLPATRVGGRWRVAFDALDALQRVGGATGADAGAGTGGATGTGADAGAGTGTGSGAGAGRGAATDAIRAVFIANRGEIAARIHRTCAALGIRAIEPATEGPDAVDLLDPVAVVEAARAAGADSVHPGFGFLAENADFAAGVIDAGLRWVGPPPEAIRAMGDKAAARRLAAQHGIPTPPGYDGDDQSDAALGAAAAQIGVPLLVKPSAGGGGKGMRIVRDLSRAPTEFAAARRESMAAFGDDRLILERLVEGARHVEIQVLFDRHGAGIHLGERDCSTQRRHQKVLEEAPSPAIDGGLRQSMGEAALTLARAVGYESAGTCEFLVDDRGRFTFLEMNARLQVEHPVTELVTGRDLVADQLRIAAGSVLAIDQADVGFDGHAIEARLYAEDAEDGFLPATGRIERLRWPSRDGIRVDAGVVEGTVVGSRFDPMLAKIVAHGPDRAAALARLASALDDTVVLGCTTNLRFLRWLVREPAVRNGAVRTDTLERIWPPDDWQARVAIPDEAWVAAAGLLLEPAGRDGPDTGPWGGGFRVNQSATLALTAEGTTRTVRVGSSADAPGLGLPFVRFGEVVHLDLAGRSTAFRVAAPPDVDRAARAAAVAHGTGPMELLAPMPGRVQAIPAGVGTAVDIGDPVVVLEAMKMEHSVAAIAPGRVAELAVAAGDQVQRGQRLATLEPR